MKNKKIKKIEEIFYHIEVEDEEAIFRETDFLLRDIKEAFYAFECLKKKYPDKKINITKIITTTIYKPISEQQFLEEKVMKEKEYMK